VLDGCSFTNNTAQGCGAGLFADRAAVLVVDSNFNDNKGSRCEARPFCSTKVCILACLRVAASTAQPLALKCGGSSWHCWGVRCVITCVVPCACPCSVGGFGDTCRGGAIHAQRSWLGVARSSFAGNRATNGSAVLVLQPVGMSQLQDCSFDNNQPRPGTAQQMQC
jgi:hypothetical protein